MGYHEKGIFWENIQNIRNFHTLANENKMQ